MKKRIIIILFIIILTLVILGLYSTFATEETTLNDNVYNITITGNSNEIEMPADTSKTIIYKVTKTNKGVVNYGLIFTGDNITVKVYDDSKDKETDLIDDGETKFIKLYITNTGTTDSVASIKTVLGYENGDSLNNSKLVPTGYTFVEDVHCKKRAFAVYSETDYSLTFYNNNDYIVVGSDYNGKKVTAVYTGFETDNSSEQPGWGEYKRSIESVTVAETVSPVNTAYWFYDMDECTNMDLAKLDTSNVTIMNAMFGAVGYDKEAIKITGLDKWNTSNVESMYYMFARVGRAATTWNIGDISNWDVSKVKNMNQMFFYTGNNTPNRIIDLSGWNTSSLINTKEMFAYCGTLLRIIVSSGWNKSKVTDSADMFFDCTDLIGGLGTLFNASYVDGTYARIDGGTSAPGYFCGGPVVMTSDEIRITNNVSGNTYGSVYLEIYNGSNWQMIDYLYTGAQYSGTYKHTLSSGNYDIRLRISGSVSDYIIVSNNAYFQQNATYGFYWSQSWQDDQNVVLWKFSMVYSYY